MVKDKNILLGISGGIAAYKAALLVRLFKKAGARVRVIGTANAFEFISRVTMESLSENKVYDQVFGANNDYSTEHISLTDWGDVMVVAPATANIIGKMANGIADDALSTSLMAFNKQVFVAPAMNCKMFDHFATQRNLQTLRQHGVTIIEPAQGYLACGYEGRGRMEEPGQIFQYVESYFQQSLSLNGRKVMVTAGPTHEAIDPVRFIGNHSSGKMGYKIAGELLKRGAHVELVTGPVNLTLEHENLNITRVTTAAQMLQACLALFPQMDATIMAAAVADYTPVAPESHKIKKQQQEEETLTIQLMPTADILARMGAKKTKDQLLVGFALETHHELEYATRKLQQKNLDLIVLNSLNDKGAGFEADTNKITIINNKKEIFRYPLKSKEAVASDIIDLVEEGLKIR
ncbi:MAG: bifunctional phosphopantothenoylcysteine decarboxylase/phosphopantothenate--cysteine ligase CoaBC [Bacteroidales bacterium]